MLDPKQNPAALTEARDQQERARRGELGADLALEEPEAEPAKKRKKPVSANGMSLAYCRERGWVPATVEQRVPHTFITRDLFGFIDIVVLDGKRGLLGVQATTGDHTGHRIDKINDTSPEGVRPAALAWLRAGLRLEVWGWRKRNDRTPGAKKVWTLRRIKAELVDDELVWDDVE